jgi:hypothetical protein
MNNENRFQWKKLFTTKWSVKPVDTPSIDADFPHLDSLTRSAESIRYSILSFEYWISKGGQVREWVRHNSRLAILLAIPAFLVLPVITFILGQLVLWMVALVAIAGHLIVFPALALVALVVVLIIIKLSKALLK